MIASTSPGKPAPLPRSTRRWGPGPISGRSWRLSATCRVQINSVLAGPIRLIRARHLVRSSTWALSRSSDSRETPWAPAIRSGAESAERGGIAAAPDRAPSQAGQNEAERRRRHPVDPCRMAERRRLEPGQLLARLDRQPAHRQIVEIDRDCQFLVPPERRDLGLLPRHIAGIERIGLEPPPGKGRHGMEL